jgi:hypothetical protein
MARTLNMQLRRRVPQAPQVLAHQASNSSCTTLVGGRLQYVVRRSTPKSTTHPLQGMRKEVPAEMEHLAERDQLVDAVAEPPAKHLKSARFQQPTGTPDLQLQAPSCKCHNWTAAAELKAAHAAPLVGGTGDPNLDLNCLCASCSHGHSAAAGAEAEVENSRLPAALAGNHVEHDNGFLVASSMEPAGHCIARLREGSRPNAQVVFHSVTSLQSAEGGGRDTHPRGRHACAANAVHELKEPSLPREHGGGYSMASNDSVATQDGSLLLPHRASSARTPPAENTQQSERAAVHSSGMEGSETSLQLASEISPANLDDDSVWGQTVSIGSHSVCRQSLAGNTSDNRLAARIDVPAHHMDAGDIEMTSELVELGTGATQSEVLSCSILSDACSQMGNAARRVCSWPGSLPCVQASASSGQWQGGLTEAEAEAHPYPAQDTALRSQASCSHRFSYPCALWQGSASQGQLIPCQASCYNAPRPREGNKVPHSLVSCREAVPRLNEFPRPQSSQGISISASAFSDTVPQFERQHKLRRHVDCQPFTPLRSAQEGMQPHSLGFPKCDAARSDPIPQLNLLLEPVLQHMSPCSSTSGSCRHTAEHSKADSQPCITQVASSRRQVSPHSSCVITALSKTHSQPTLPVESDQQLTGWHTSSQGTAGASGCCFQAHETLEHAHERMATHTSTTNPGSSLRAGIFSQVKISSVKRSTERSLLIQEPPFSEASRLHNAWSCPQYHLSRQQTLPVPDLLSPEASIRQSSSGRQTGQRLSRMLSVLDSEPWLPAELLPEQATRQAVFLNAHYMDGGHRFGRCLSKEKSTTSACFEVLAR